MTATTMRKHTFTFFRYKDDTVYGYRFDITRIEAQSLVALIEKEEGEKVYYMEGYHE